MLVSYNVSIIIVTLRQSDGDAMDIVIYMYMQFEEM